MKKILLILSALIFSASTLFAQSVQGTWTINFSSPEGEPVAVALTLAENTYTVDFGNDGEHEVEGSYTLEGETMTLWDTSGNPDYMCEANAKGIYTITLTDATMTMTRISDECKGRGGPSGVMEFSRQ